MRKNYTPFNIASLFTILLSTLLLVATFQATTDTEIHFEDPGLEQAVRETIGKAEGEIEASEINLLQELDASEYGIERLEGIEHLPELRTLNLEDNFVESVAPLQSLTKLESLNLRNNEITDLEAVDFDEIIFLDIQELSLRHNVVRDDEGNATRLSDVHLLGQMINLRELDVRDNHIEELAPIGNLRNLEELDVRENRIETIEALEPLNSLEALNVRDNAIESLEPLRFLTRLTDLNIHSNPDIESLEPLSDLINLETLIMRNVPIQDEGEFLRNLTSLQRLNAIDTDFETINPTIVEELRNRGALQGEVRPERMLYTIESPTLARESGFYTEGFELEIAAPEEEVVYYTLDGSEPTMQSEIYEEPLQIAPNDESPLTVVRAKVLAEDQTMSDTVTRSYFVHEEIDERFELPVFSLVTDPDNLFSEEKGIYHEENSQNSGSDWERPVHVDFFDNDGRPALKQDLGIRLHGGATRVYDQKSLRLYAKSDYDTEDYMHVDFFDDLESLHDNEEVTTFKRILLRNSGNDWSQTMFSDALMQSLVAPLGTFETQAYQPSVVYINGEYFGIHNIRERYDEYYFETHYNIAHEDLVMLENDGQLYRGGNSDVYPYQNMIQFIEENGLEEDKNYAYIQTLMDTENYRDYFVSQVYFGNSDWPHNNIRFWRKKTDEYIKDAPYGHDGRWRWLLFDTDHGFYYSENPIGEKPYPVNHHHNTMDYVMSELDGRSGTREWPNFLFRSLMSNQQFKTDYLNRMNDLLNSSFMPEVVVKQIDSKVKGISEEMPAHIERWDGIESMEEWKTSIERKYTFANERPDLLRGFIMDEFDIDRTVTVTVGNETESGYVRVNTIDITNDLPGNTGEALWSGRYFTDYAITLEAVAKEGYVFSHWEGTNQSKARIEIQPTEDLSVRAIFTPVNE